MDEYGKWDGLQADNREKIKYELAKLKMKGSKQMSNLEDLEKAAKLTCEWEQTCTI